MPKTAYRLFAFLLCLLLLCGTLPFALAEDPEEGTISLVPAEDEGTLSPAEAGTAAPAAPVEPAFAASVLSTEEASEAVTIGDACFPDPAFRAFLRTEIDKDGDGSLSTTERGVLWINCPGRGISSLRGIEFFPGLAGLDCSANRLSQLDLRANSALRELYCNGNRLTKLELGGCRDLQVLSCDDNYLASLDLRANPALESVSCSCNLLTTLDLGALSQLRSLSCDNDLLSSLDLRANPRLQSLSCSGNGLRSLYLGGNPQLESLACGGNRLELLDLSANPLLRSLSCENNGLCALDLNWNPALISLYCEGNPIPALDLRSVPELLAYSREQDLDPAGTEDGVRRYGRRTLPESGDEVPAYVLDEADSVALRVRARLSEDSIVVLTGADSHQLETGDLIGRNTMAGNLHALQAMEILASGLTFDCAAFMGDYTAGSASTTLEEGRQHFASINCGLDRAFRNLPQFRLVGNHDPLGYSYQSNGAVLSQEELYSLIGSYNDDGVTVMGSTTAGYCYRDFPEKRLRVICLNTSEVELPFVSAEGVSPAQKRWFADTLIGTPSGFGILILAHFPLDWGDLISMSHILRAYAEEQSDMLIDGTAYDFTGKNKSAWLLQIHGHVHTSLADRLRWNDGGVGVPYDVFRISCPCMNFYRTNEYGQNDKTEYYGIEFGTPGETWSKVADTAADTAFSIFVITPSRQTVSVVTYGAGPDWETYWGTDPVPVKEISFTSREGTLSVGRTLTLLPSFTPANASDQTVCWTSSDETVASVSNGHVLALKPGSAEIRASTPDGTCHADFALLVEADPGIFYPVLTVDADVLLIRSEEELLPPLIQLQPRNQTAGEGETVRLSLAASGGGLNYQWQWRSSDGSGWKDSGLPGASSPTLSVKALSYRDGYQYRCVVRSSRGEVVSDSAVLTVSPAPLIRGQPMDVTARSNSPAAFTVTAAGSDLSYQWQWRPKGGGTWKNSGDSGSRTNTLFLTAKPYRNGYHYRCQVSNAYGSVCSDAAVLTVDLSPQILAPPSDVTEGEGGTAFFSVTASGPELFYQWQWSRDGGATWNNSSSVTPGYDTATLQVTASASRNGYRYRCLVSNSAGTAISGAAVLTVDARPVVTAQPRSLTADLGSIARFSVTASRASDYQWQWSKNGGKSWSNSSSVTPGYDTATLQVTASASRSGYRYRCLVSNSAGTVISEAAVLTVDARPVVTVQPQSVSVSAGETALFSVTASRATGYRWQWSKDGGVTWSDSSSVTPGYDTASLQVTASPSRNGYLYRCKVTNSGGTAISESALLTVH